MDAVVSRQAQEVQAAMVIAKKYPRDEVKAWERIMRACQRPSLAEDATYSYPKGGTNVSGPSIRLAECIAQNWGNIDFGIIELHQQEGKSEMMAYAWDLETNTRQTKIFTVTHAIEKKGGIKKELTDPRDIYEITANQGARRLRACILGIIPSDVVEDAVRKCDDTLSKADGDIPIIDRVKKMVTVFDGLGVTPTMIEKRFNKKLDRMGEQEIVLLRKIYTSIRDGFSKVSDQFEPHVDTPTDLEKKPVAATEAKKEPEKPKSEPPKRETKPAKAGDVYSLLESQMTLEGISLDEVVEFLVRKRNITPAKKLSDIGVSDVEYALTVFEVMASQIRMDRKANAGAFVS